MPHKKFHVCEQGDFASESYAAGSEHEDSTGHAVFEEIREVPRVSVVRTIKPARVIAEATATVQVVGGAAHSEVVNAGLKALGETRDSLFDFGVRAADGRRITSAAIWDQTVTVYAHRD